MSLNYSSDNSVKEAQTKGERLSPRMCPVGQQRRPGRDQNIARKKWT